LTASRLAIVTTHPIQYHAAWFRALSAHPEIDLEVFYCHKATPKEQAEAGFGVEFDWDVSLLEGYQHRFLRNVAAEPGVGTFGGLNTPEISEMISRERFDAVMVNGWHYKSAWQTMRACWKTGTPVMARSDSHLYMQRSALKKAAKWPFYRWFIPRLDACLAVGTWSKEYFQHYGAKADRIFIVPHVIDDSYFCRETTRVLSQRNELRARWGLEAGVTVFLFAGKFIEKKRPMDVVQAIDRATKQGARVAGLMVGDGWLRQKCEEFVKKSNVPVRFAGFLNQSEIVKAYVAADVLILASESETWGLVVNEAMACGLPCLVSDQVGCGPDMIVANVTGAVFPVADIDGLAALMAVSPQHFSRMGENARTKAGAYSLNSAVEGIVRACAVTTGRS
jgi:glycosyltransferase involved in cell wall biosynthesis